MPARDRQPAKFGPVPPDLDLLTLVEQTPNFKWVNRISCRAIDEAGLDVFEKTVEQEVIKKGMPLVIDGWHHKLDRWTFSTQWLHDNIGNKPEQARWLNKQENMALSITHYLDNMGKLCDQWNHYNYKDTNRQRLYLKDIDCPELWHEKLRETIPPNVFYLNDNTGDVGGPGSVAERNPNGIGTRMSRGIARAGDLMSSLPPAMRAENLMCYIGPEGTYTPAHREMCASLGQNLMVETSEALDEGGKRVKPGSSIWFMTETCDRQVVSEYWLSSLGHDIEVEKHFAHINAWRKAPFTVYVVEQKVGDMILIPPLAPHQVWNRGTRTMKVAWNRTTVDTLELALAEALPRARLVCRDEQYKNKSIILFSLNKYYGLLKQHEDRLQDAAQRGDEAGLKALGGSKIRQLRKDFKRLFHLFNRILLSEMFSPDLSAEKKVEYAPYDSNVTCAYCRGNIFNRFLTCRNCVIKLEDGEDDTYDICMECYVMGRSCKCIGHLEWVEQFPWHDLVEKHDLWRDLFVKIDGGPKDNSPQPLSVERKFLRERTLAEICQVELKRRPFHDSNKPVPESESDPEDDEDGEDDTAAKKADRKKKKKKKQSEKWLTEHLPCHICGKRHPIWKEAVCATCSAAFCFGSLWRGFDLMPQQVLEDKHWRCPKCLGICSCRTCHKLPHHKPFEPSGTVLGHDTREFADPRSVESLVDFSVSNRHWLKKVGDDDDLEASRRLERRQSQALRQKQNAEMVNEASEAEDEPEDDLDAGDGVPDEDEDNPSRPTSSDEDIPIDPALTGGKAPSWRELGKRHKAQTQATKALAAMDTLSRLEEDPAAFISAAGLGDREDGQSLFIPEVDVAEDEMETDTTVPSMNDKAINGKHVKSKDQAAGARSSKNRKDAPLRIFSDLNPTQNDDDDAQANTANERFQAQAERRRMGDAKKNKQLTAARAAIRGLKKLVTLKLASGDLARFPAGEARVVRQRHLSPSDSVVRETAPIVESNLTQASSTKKQQQQQQQQPPQQKSPSAAVIAASAKKRLRDEEIDEDFSTTIRERRSQQQKRKRDLQAGTTQDVPCEASDGDDPMDIDDLMAQDASDGEDIDNASSSVPANTTGTPRAGPNKRRPLPGYLAQRDDADPEAPIPKELRSEPRSRARKLNGIPPSAVIDVDASSRSSSRSQDEEAQQSYAFSESNRLAKLQAVQGLDGQHSAPGDKESPRRTALTATPSPRPSAAAAASPATSRMAGRPASTTTTPSTIRKSIFASRGRGGKFKIKSSRNT